MNWEEWFGWLSLDGLSFDWRFWLAHSLALVIFGFGLIGCLLPVLPGTLIVWMGVLVYRLIDPTDSIGWNFIIISGVIMLLTLLFDFLFAYWGGKRFGGTWKGGVGAIIGGIVGIFLPPPLLWIFLGPPIGAVIGELIARQKFAAARRSGYGTFLGGMVSYVMKIIYSFGVIFLFYIHLIWS